MPKQKNLWSWNQTKGIPLSDVDKLTPLGRKVNPIVEPRGEFLPYRIGERPNLAMDPRGSQLTYRSQSAVNPLIPVNALNLLLILVNKETPSMGVGPNNQKRADLVRYRTRKG